MIFMDKIRKSYPTVYDHAILQNNDVEIWFGLLYIFLIMKIEQQVLVPPESINLFMLM